MPPLSGDATQRGKRTGPQVQSRASQSSFGRLVCVLPEPRPLGTVRQFRCSSYPASVGRNWIQMVLVSVYWSWAWTDLSWPPNPDCLYPPKGVVMSPSEYALTPM